MDLLFNFVQQGLSFLVPMTILLGILIFVHEAGHFLVAKFYNVRVETFSLGFGKKIFQFKRGETTYCISIIPLGGYVKMFGDDPSMEVPLDQREGAFLHKPVGQRIAVVLAGPLMNFFFAIFVFFIIALIGEQMIKPIVGDIKTQSIAWQEGFRSGDIITSINGTPVKTWQEVKTHIELPQTQQITFGIDRHAENISLQTTTALIANPNILSTEEKIGSIEGLGIMARSSQVGISRPYSLAAKEGMMTFDEINSINNTPVKKWYEVVALLQNDFAQEKLLEIKYTRYPTKLSQNTESSQHTASIEIPDDLVGELTPETLGFEIPDLFISHFTEDSPAEQAGLLSGDKIQAIDGERLTDRASLLNKIYSYTPEQQHLNIEVVRKGEIQNVQLTPILVEQTNNQGGRESKYAIGIYNHIVETPTDFTIIRTLNPILALQDGVTKAVFWTKLTCLGFLRLLQARVSHRSIGGPIMIGQVASRTFQMGLSYFLKIMAIISINLFIINMLPIPILDGGHLVFFTIEALRGAPLSMRKMEIAQMIGLIVILGLMALAFFNDISRIFEN